MDGKRKKVPQADRDGSLSGNTVPKRAKREQKDLTALQDAARNGQSDIIQALLQEGVKLDATDKDGCTPLHKAAGGGHTDTVQVLLQAGAKVDATDEYGDTSLHKAADGGHTDTLQVLLHAGANVDATDRYCDTPLHKAAHGGHTDTVQVLLQAGTKADATNKDSYTPLHYAAGQGHTDIVQVLVQAGAKVDATSKYGENPLHKAADEGYTETVQVLLQAGAKVDATNEYGDTPLHKAADEAHTDTVQVLLQAGAKVDATDKDSYTPLHYAAGEGHTDTVLVLLQAGAKVDATNKYGDTPLHKAADRGHTDIVQVLLQAGAKVDNTDENKRTPLAKAIARSHTETAHVLVDAGADISKVDLHTLQEVFGALQSTDSLESTQQTALKRLAERLKQTSVTDAHKQGSQSKCMMIGEVGSGKTSTVNMLKEGKPNPAPAGPDGRTIGIEVHGITLKKDIQVYIHDFAGHETYHHSQQCFQSALALTMLAVNIEEYEKTDTSYQKRVGNWLNMMIARSPTGIIRTFCTHIDKCSPDEVNDKCDDILRRITEQEKHDVRSLKVYLRQVEKSIDCREQAERDVGMFEDMNIIDLQKQKNIIEDRLRHRPNLPSEMVKISCVTSEGLEDLKAAIVSTIEENPEYFPKMTVPKVWIDVQNNILEHRRSKSYLKFDEYREAVEKRGIRNSTPEFDELVIYFQIIGFLIHYTDPKLRHVVFHDPHWLMKMIAKPFDHNYYFRDEETGGKVFQVFNEIPKPDQASMIKNLKEKGLISKELLRCFWSEDNLDRDMENNLIYLLQRFDICFPIPKEKIEDPEVKKHGDHYCFPGLVMNQLSSEVDNRVWPDDLQDNDEYHLSLHFETSILPVGLFELMRARFNHYLQSRYDWQDGILGYIGDHRLRITKHQGKGLARIRFVLRMRKGALLKHSYGTVGLLNLKQMLRQFPGSFCSMMWECRHCLQLLKSNSDAAIDPKSVPLDVFLSADHEGKSITLECPNAKDRLKPNMFYPVEIPTSAHSSSMSQKHRDALTKNRVALVEDMDTEKLLDHLYAEFVINEEDMERIKNQTTRQDQSRALLDCLPRRSDKAFTVLCAALERDANQKFLAELLRGHEDQDTAGCVIS